MIKKSDKFDTSADIVYFNGDVNIYWSKSQMNLFNLL